MTTQPPQEWFVSAVARGLIELTSVRFPFSPRREEIEGTILAWSAALWRGRAWCRGEDQDRIDTAFLRLVGGSRWPTPRDFIDALPPRPRPAAPVARIDSDARAAAAVRNIAAIAAMLHLNPLYRSDAGEDHESNPQHDP